MYEAQSSDSREKLAVAAYSLLRLTVGVVLAAHGFQTIQDPSGWRDQVESLWFPAPQIMAPLAILAALGGGMGLILGLLTPLSALAVGGQMIVAIATVDWGRGPMASNNGFEYPLVLLAAALYIAIRGGGPLSIDAVIMRHWPRAGVGPRRSAWAFTWLLGLLPLTLLSCEGSWWSAIRNSETDKVEAQSSTGGAAESAPAPTSVVVLPGGQSVADVAEKVTPSVVSVFSEQAAKPSREGGRELPPFFSDPFFEHFFGQRGLQPFGDQSGQLPQLPSQSLGSGVIVSADGVIMTNHHVVEGAEKIRVAFDDGRELQAKVIGADPKSDLAVLRVDAKDLSALAIGPSQELRTGDLVLAVGNPFGLRQTVTMGIVSAVGRANMGITDYEDFIQTDAAINPGNSGGALVTMDGRLVGINTAIASRTGGYQGIGFAIPSKMAVQIKDAILKHGKVVRGWLGVVIQDLDDKLAAALKVEADAGVLIADVTENSPAARSGLERGDVITSFKGQKPADATHLRRLVAEAGKDQVVPVQVIRDGKRRSIDVKLGEQPDELSAQAPNAPSRSEQVEALAGVELRELDAATRSLLKAPGTVRGVVISRVDPGSAAARSGLRSGDVILEVDGKATPDLQSLRAQVERGEGNRLLLLWRDGMTLFLALPAGS